MNSENKKFYCPLCDWSCPYLNSKDGSCTMVDEGYNPVEECDEAMYYSNDDE